MSQGGHVGSTASRYHLSCGQVLLLWGCVHFCKAITWAGLGVVQGMMYRLCNILPVQWCLLALSSHVYGYRAQRLAFLHQTWFCICVCQGQKMLPSVVDTAAKGNALSMVIIVGSREHERALAGHNRFWHWQIFMVLYATSIACLVDVTFCCMRIACAMQV